MAPMNYLARDFYGNTRQKVPFDDLTVTETDYDYEYIDWHYHENPYFSLVTGGLCKHISKAETLECDTGSLLFHNCHEAHCNHKFGLARGFQVELSHDWCRKYGVRLEDFPGSVLIDSINVKLLFNNIYKEAKLSDGFSKITLDSLLLNAFSILRDDRKADLGGKPRWAQRIDEILRENYSEPLSLAAMARELGLHWAHLSREFPKHFHCTFGEYARKVRVERSLNIMRRKDLSLTDVAFECGFSDQSHFIRCFREFIGVTPGVYRRLL
jgi:AraC-like DNA-binding protein